MEDGESVCEITVVFCEALIYLRKTLFGLIDVILVWESHIYYFLPKYFGGVCLSEPFLEADLKFMPIISNSFFCGNMIVWPVRGGDWCVGLTAACALYVIRRGLNTILDLFSMLYLSCTGQT